jgi:hypothetical protein
MISTEDLNAYLSIKAPDTLKERVMSAVNGKSNRISSTVHTYYAIAAAVVIIVASFVFFPSAKTNLYFDGNRVSKDAVIMTAVQNNARIAPLSLNDIRDFEFTLKTGTEAKISVSHGILSSGDLSDRELTLSHDGKLTWTVDLEESTEYFITIETKSRTDTYCISRNQSGELSLRKK